MCGWRFNIENSWYVYLYCGNWEVPKRFDSWCNYEQDKIFFVVLKLPFLSFLSWALLSVHGGWQKQWSFFVSGNYDKINQTKEEKQCLEYKFNTLTCKVIPQIENKGIDWSKFLIPISMNWKYCWPLYLQVEFRCVNQSLSQRFLLWLSWFHLDQVLSNMEVWAAWGGWVVHFELQSLNMRS